MTGTLFQHLFAMLHLNLDFSVFSSYKSKFVNIIKCFNFPNTRQILMTEENNHLPSHVSWY